MAVTVKIVENGPCLIQGTATYVDADGNRQQTEKANVALCRCGASQNKPFCDGSHRTNGFAAPAVELTIES